jgi:outer membrane lipoprotein LolB
MAVRTGERGGTATVLWQRMGDHHQLMLFGPFGGGRVRIVENTAGAELRDNKERVFRGDTAEAVLMKGVGWHVPFRELGFWVRGLPAPGALDDLLLDERGRAAHFSQSGWEVDYRAYREVDDLMLPAKVFIAARPGTVRVTAADGKDLGDQLSVRISIRAWNDEPEWAESSR